ncbi:MAG TPA: VOC family protein [Tepidisphaeraceae bacterium]|jgi:glyoxylase I family protein|nr:VOC family protein [Tepidisphaeraceae bacterium]HEV8605511.1 VOC family protein [Tepidisphaeraceae bacterium]
MFLSIDHPAIACYDVQRQIKWYCDNLAMRVIARGETAALVGYGDGVTGGAMIELMAKKHEGPPPIEVPTHSPGLRHLALRVKNFDEAKSKLASAGALFIGQPGQAVGGGRIQSFRDPEGNELQIVERPSTDN